MNIFAKCCYISQYFLITQGEICSKNCDTPKHLCNDLRMKQLLFFALLVLFMSSPRAFAEPLPLEQEFFFASDVQKYSVSEFSNTLVTLDSQKKVKLYNFLNKKVISELSLPDLDMTNVLDIQASGDGKFVAIQKADAPQVLVYRFKNSELVISRSFKGTTEGLHVKFSPDDDFVAIANPFFEPGAQIEIYDLKTELLSVTVGYDKDSDEDGFQDMKFYKQGNQAFLMTLSMYDCMVSYWSTVDATENQIFKNCASSMGMGLDKNYLLLGSGHIVEVFDQSSLDHIGNVGNRYMPPRVQDEVLKEIFAYDLSDNTLVFLGEGPDDVSVLLRGIDFTNNQAKFEYNMTDEGFTKLRMTKDKDKRPLLVLWNDKQLIVVDYSLL